MQKKENQTKIFLISIIVIIAVVLLVNNFNNMSGAVTYSPDAIRYGNCVLDQDCNLKTGDVTYLDGVKIMIGTIGSRGDVRIGVNEEVITIGKAEKVIVKGLEITNKVTYYDWKNSKNNYVVLFIAEEGGLSNEVTYQGVLDMLNKCVMIPKYETQTYTCNEACIENAEPGSKLTCIFGINSIGGFESGKEYLESCHAGWNKEDYTMCMCCSLP